MMMVVLGMAMGMAVMAVMAAAIMISAIFWMKTFVGYQHRKTKPAQHIV